MREDLITEDIVDLGAASERTLGTYDILLKESFVIPEARD